MMAKVKLAGDNGTHSVPNRALSPGTQARGPAGQDEVCKIPNQEYLVLPCDSQAEF